ncbi:DUF3124 domain-containing protein [Aegicerativicinus sediminis]|uniref:DUF3124 domain-containing protein n=1 Tax=Aegicerativicinus sediminis TaxID=2893202 RepID=UPI001E2D00C5|nr:DUF3124 domain-containing protein [Aegicerativicinus sediminis]
MRHILFIYLFISLISCEKEKEYSSINPINWEKRTVPYSLSDSLEQGSTYLSIYSQIYSLTEHQTHNLTATVSMRNINKSDSIFITKAEYFHTDGTPIRTYFQKPIYIAPMEAVEIVIDEIDAEGGTGANFIFDWKKDKDSNDPYFEGVMISTSGQQGLSFTTQGIKIE